VELEVRELLASTASRGTRSRSSAARPSRRSTTRPVPDAKSIWELAGRPGREHSASRCREIDKDFLLPIEDVFSISGRGTVVTGAWSAASCAFGDEIEIVGLRDTQKKTVTGVEMFKKLLDPGARPATTSAFCSGASSGPTSSAARCSASRAPSSPTRSFKGKVYILSKDEGGRHTPFFNNYRPQFFIRTTDVTGAASCRPASEMVMPGDDVELEIELISPIAMEKGLKFAIREGGPDGGRGDGRGDPGVRKHNESTWATTRSASASRATTTVFSTSRRPPRSSIRRGALARRSRGRSRCRRRSRAGP